MSDEGMIVVDPHAFRTLWPALAVWLFLFLTAGDGGTILRRAAALEFGRPAQAVVVAKRRRRQAAGDEDREVIGGTRQKPGLY